MTKRGRAPGELTGTQRTWAMFYTGAARFNASEAARLTGCAEAEGRQMMNRPQVAAFVERLLAERSARYELSARSWVEELLALSYSDVTDLLEEHVEESGRRTYRLKELDKLPKQITRCIQQMKVKPDGSVEFRLHDKVGPLRLLGQYMRLLQDQAPPAGAPTSADTASAVVAEEAGPRFLGGLTLIGPGATLPHEETETDADVDEERAGQAGAGNNGAP